MENIKKPSKLDSFLYREWDELVIRLRLLFFILKNYKKPDSPRPALGRLWAKKPCVAPHASELWRARKKLPNMDSFLYREWESNPHALKDTWPSTMPVYQFQHLGVLIIFTRKTPKLLLRLQIYII